MFLHTGIIAVVWIPDYIFIFENVGVKDRRQTIQGLLGGSSKKEVLQRPKTGLEHFTISENHENNAFRFVSSQKFDYLLLIAVRTVD